MSTGAGKFRHLVWVQKATRTRDKVGQWREVWTDDFQLWVAMWPTSAARIVDAEKLSFAASMRMRCWFTDRVQYANRIRYGERIFQVVSLVVPDEARKYLDIICQEVKKVADN